MRKIFTFTLFVFVSIIVCGCLSTSDDSNGEFVSVKGNSNYRFYGKETSISDFYICKHEVTQQEWESVMGEHAGKFQGDNLPVENISWYMAVIYCNKRSLKEGLTPCYSVKTNGKELDWKSLKQSYLPRTLDEKRDWENISCDFNTDGYRLPTVEEWMYAHEGGAKSGNHKYSGGDVIGDVAWYKDISNNKTHDIMTKTPNELGIYDMEGNVAEWCWNEYGSWTKKDSVFSNLYATMVVRSYAGTSYTSSDPYTNNNSARLYPAIKGSNPDAKIAESGLRVVRSRF